jgi:hypothetical protein
MAKRDRDSLVLKIKKVVFIKGQPFLFKLI